MRCGHHICNHCIVKLEKPICPTCRAPIFPDPAASAQPAADPLLDPLDPAYFRDGSLMDRQGRHGARPLALHAGSSSRIIDAASVDETRPLLPPGANPPHLQRQFSRLAYSPYRPPTPSGRRGPV